MKHVGCAHRAPRGSSFVLWTVRPWLKQRGELCALLNDPSVFWKKTIGKKMQKEVKRSMCQQNEEKPYEQLAWYFSIKKYVYINNDVTRLKGLPKARNNDCVRGNWHSVQGLVLSCFLPGCLPHAGWTKSLQNNINLFQKDVFFGGFGWIA